MLYTQYEYREWTVGHLLVQHALLFVCNWLVRISRFLSFKLLATVELLQWAICLPVVVSFDILIELAFK